ncbi:MAG: Uma2 family endonuclease [candidate division KSB1 bacterium]|nr:Uma2 family endonuclease [candidate division KSB1 bacterium]MDZ7300749.1 Uma2 family endonuclease [candidate division KSB1 bacterium]MDZ7309981.1 Uma2 family endonuclease [candidate division KSB1 bacterium]
MPIATVDTAKRLEVFTYEDYLQLPDDGKRYEIIDGELYMSPAPTLGHQRTIRRFLFVIEGFLQENPCGEVFQAPTDIILSDIDVLQPDIVFITKEKFDILTRENVQGAPDLVIEVLSPGTEKRDRTIKLKTYSKFGVREYWMANEEQETVEVWRRKDTKLAFHALLDKTQTLMTPLFPGLEIPLSKIFRKV